MNPFPALTAPFALTFLSNLSNTEEVALVANLGKTSLAKGTACFFWSSYVFFAYITYQIT